MLIRFLVSNFLSFDEEQEFNMLAADFRTHKHHVYELGKVNVLKSAAIYGANGAGKSNLIKAIEYLQNSVHAGRLLKSIDSSKFKLNSENQSMPVSFEIEFFVEGKIYSYKLVINGSRVLEEWLYESGITKADKLIFERVQGDLGRPQIKFNAKFAKKKENELLIRLLEQKLLKDDELLIGKQDVIGSEDVTNVFNWFSKNLIIIYPDSKYTGLVAALSHSEQFKRFSNNLLKTFDTGIVGLETETIDIHKYFGEDDKAEAESIISQLESGHEGSYVLLNNGGVLARKEDGNYVIKKIIAYHHDVTGNPVKFDLEDESDGTLRILDFLPAIESILVRPVTIIIDEIDQSLHSKLLYSLIEKIMEDNKAKGQLVFTTHDSNLLNFQLFRQDEIWFAEKQNKTGSTHLYSLSDYKPRYDLDIRKGYLKGRFGAIPFLTQLED